MSRVIVIAVAVLVFFWLLRRALGSRGKSGGSGPAAKDKAPAPAADLVACAHCGVNLPKGEAVAGLGETPLRHYCSEAHRRLGPR